MKTLKMKSILLFVAVMLITINTDLFAQRGYGRGMGPGLAQGQEWGCMAFIPDLTDTQKDKIESFRTNHLKNMTTMRNQMFEKRTKLRTLQTADNVNMVAVNSTIDEMSALRAKMQKERANHHQDIRSILTDDQRVYFDARGFGRGRGKGMGPGYGRGRGRGFGQGSGNCWRF